MMYQVDGMTCSGCVRSVKQALAEALPALEVQVDLETHSLQVEGVHTETQLKAVVEEAGFDWLGPLAQEP